MRRIFHKIRLRNYSQTVFLENQNWAYVWIHRLKFYTVCFYCMTSRGLSKYIEIKLAFTSYKAFSKNKKLYITIKTNLTNDLVSYKESD